MYRTFRPVFSLGLAVALASSLLLAGCSTTVESTPAAAKALEQGQALPPAVTGFLGPDAAKLQPGGKGKPALVWVNPNAQWAQYTKIYLKPVEFWAAEDSKV